MDAGTREAQPRKPKLGRPTKYRPVFCKRIIEYFSIPPYREEKKTVITKHGAEITETKQIPNDPPLLVRFAESIGVSRKQLIEWTKQHAAFGDAYVRAKELQEAFVVSNGLLKNYDGNFAFKFLVNTANWRGETKTVEITATLEDRLAGLLGSDQPKQIEGTVTDAEPE